MIRLPHNPYVLNNQLLIQELVVSSLDKELVATPSGNVVVLIGEPISSVTMVLDEVDNAATHTINSASISIVNSNLYGFPTLPAGSTLYTDGRGNGVSDAILIKNLVLGAHDHLIIRYVVKESTLTGYLYGPYNIPV